MKRRTVVVRGAFAESGGRKVLSLYCCSAREAHDRVHYLLLPWFLTGALVGSSVANPYFNIQVYRRIP